jgi:hypothetical protein
MITTTTTIRGRGLATTDHANFDQSAAAYHAAEYSAFEQQQQYEQSVGVMSRDQVGRVGGGWGQKNKKINENEPVWVLSRFFWTAHFWKPWGGHGYWGGWGVSPEFIRC